MDSLPAGAAAVPPHSSWPSVSAGLTLSACGISFGKFDVSASGSEKSATVHDLPGGSGLPPGGGRTYTADGVKMTGSLVREPDGANERAPRSAPKSYDPVPSTREAPAPNSEPPV